jgi:hypothetical protein
MTLTMHDVTRRRSLVACYTPHPRFPLFFKIPALFSRCCHNRAPRIHALFHLATHAPCHYPRPSPGGGFSFFLLGHSRIIHRYPCIVTVIWHSKRIPPPQRMHSLHEGTKERNDANDRSRATMPIHRRWLGLGLGLFGAKLGRNLSTSIIERAGLAWVDFLLVCASITQHHSLA